MVGQTISHYEITEKLGEGGMGVVYKARDIRLKRYVALKVLPPETVADPERKQRFVQEARAASALNHPNIITVHDIDQADGVDFIAMEYVEGKTLDELIGRKGLKLSEALKYAVQIADALAAAHAAGIVHRDLKPGNVMVTTEGRVKVLDFGLAKLTETVPAGDEGTTQAEHPKTGSGMIVGTVSYMSPEQAEGKKVDARSDIFSFGSVLYEMLTGRRAFRRDSPALTLAAVLHLEPPPLPGGTPAELERLVARCLRKDPARRLQTMADLKVALEELKEDSDSGKLGAAPATVRPRRRKLLWAAGALALLLAAGGGVAWWVLSRSSTPRVVSVDRLTFEPGVALWPAVSSDGKLAVYSSDREGNFDLYLQQIGGRQTMRLTRDEADDWQPDFSPDGSRVVFRSERQGGGIYIVDTLGGAERKIADRGWIPRLSPDGSTIAYLVRNAFTGRARMYLVSANGGPSRAFEPEFEVPAVAFGNQPPLWSPDGRRILFVGLRGGDARTRSWWVAPVDGGEPVAAGEPPRQSGPGVIRMVSAWTGKHVYFLEGNTVEGSPLYRVPIAPESGKVAGAPQQLTSSEGVHAGGDVSSDGRLVFALMSGVNNVWRVPLDADRGTVTGPPRQLTAESHNKLSLTVAGNGSRLAYEGVFQPRQGRLEIRVLDIATGRQEVIPTSGLGLPTAPRLSFDGSRLAYNDQSGGKPVAYVVNAGQGAPAGPACENCTLAGFFPDPGEVLARTGRQLYRQHLQTGVRTLLLDDSIGDPVVSPDGRWLAFTAEKPDDRAAVYIAPVREKPVLRRDWTEIAEDRNRIGSPRWSPDGNLLYYFSARDGVQCVWAQRFDREKALLGPAIPVFHGHGIPSTRLINIVSMGIASGGLYLMTGTDVKSNIWMMKLDEP